MPRFHVIFADPTTNEISGAIIKTHDPVDAILKHPWIATIYRDSYIENNFHAEDEDNCRQNIFNFTSWSILCVNLDEEILRDLNGRSQLEGVKS